MAQKKSEREQREATKQSRWGFRGKTVWDWLQLLIVPLVLVLIGLAFSMQQDARQQHIEDQRAQQAQKIENQRAEAERELAEQRRQDEALQAYLDKMSQLILEENLLEAEEFEPVYTLAQARTSTLITRLDAERNQSVAEFLTYSKLTKEGNSLLTNTKLDGAALRDAFLPEADLSYTDLRDADLSSSFLADAKLNRSFQVHIDLREADLSGADLAYADLTDANLSYAGLSKSHLNADTHLSGADLSYADLGGAEGVSDEQLAAARLSYWFTSFPRGR